MHVARFQFDPLPRFQMPKNIPRGDWSQALRHLKPDAWRLVSYLLGAGDFPSLSAAAAFLKSAYLRWNRSTRPALSIIFCFPV